MKRLMFVAMVATALAAAPSAEAAVVTSLRLTSGGSVTILDGSGSDLAPLPGVITFSGAGGGWWLNVTTGVGSGSGPGIGLGAMDLNSINYSSPGAAPLEILFTQTGTWPVFPGWSMHFGGTISGGSVTYTAWVDDDNGAFALTTPIGSLGPFTALSFNGAGGGSVPGLTAPYSLTQRIVITPFSGSAVAYSGNASLTPVPEPGSMVLLGTGLLGIAALARRRMRKS